MIVIVEGPDGAGKTTLARALSQHYGLSYQHEGPPPNDVDLLGYYSQKLDRVRGKNVIFDRFAMGQLVYGPMLRNDERFGTEEWRVFTRLLSAANVDHIIVMPSYDICLKRWQHSKKKELFSDKHVFDKTYERWSELVTNFMGDGHSLGCCFNTIRLKHHSWHLTVYRSNDRFAINVSLVIGLRNDDDDKRAIKLQLPQRYVGSPIALYLLVGERASGMYDLPFFSTMGSSGYLNRTIDVANISERDLAFVNMYRFNGRSEKIAEKNALGRPWKIIALGNVADDSLTSQGLPHAKLYHPQYWKRFYHREIDRYANALKLACIS